MEKSQYLRISGDNTIFYLQPQPYDTPEITKSLQYGYKLKDLL